MAKPRRDSGTVTEKEREGGCGRVGMVVDLSKVKESEKGKKVETWGLGHSDCSGKKKDAVIRS
jgi:hypothetical protein